MISKITISGVASYAAEPVEIVPNKINIIYGANGSGKTTISNIIEEIPANSACSIEWVQNIPLHTYVYNTHFKEINFGESRKLKGIFTLGQASKNENEKIEDVKQEYEEAYELYTRTNETLFHKQQERAALEEQLETICWKVFRKYRDVFRKAFSGAAYKKTFKDKIKQNYLAFTAETKICEYDDLLHRAKSIFYSDRKPLIEYTVLESALPKIESLYSWKQPIIGKTDVDIAALIEHLGNSDWVNGGRQYIMDIDGAVRCPFCQQPLSLSVRQQIEDFFDATYTRSLKKLDDELISYKNAVKELQTAIRFIVDQKSSYMDSDAIETIKTRLEARIQNNILLMERKIKEPSSVVEITSTQGLIDSINAIIKAVNSKIKVHNELIANLIISEEQLKTDVWNYIAAELKPDYDNYRYQAQSLDAAISGLSEESDNLQKKCKDLNRERVELSKNMTSIEPTIVEINEMLLSFGFLNFKIDAAEENGYYRIVRENGDNALRSLSEGEKTFITFLYFMKLIKGAVQEKEISLERVVVFDDPISSLDSNILFIVSTLIRQCMFEVKNNNGNIKQIFILTHNVYFHKELSFIGQRDWKCLHFWVLKKNNNVSEIIPYGTKNPISSSYELLWKEIINAGNTTNIITIQNTMRRIIECYFKILGGLKDENIIGKFSTMEEQQICRSLLRWLNEGSHIHNDDLYVEASDLTAEKYIDVFKKIFIETGHKAHFDMMYKKLNKES